MHIVSLLSSGFFWGGFFKTNEPTRPDLQLLYGPRGSIVQVPITVCTAANLFDKKRASVVTEY